jgi:hypothetical protein
MGLVVMLGSPEGEPKLFVRAFTVNCAGLGNAHLGASNERRDIRGIGIAIPDEAVGATRCVYDCLEHPTASHWIREFFLDCCFDPCTTIPLGDSQQTSVRDVPSIIDVLKLTKAKIEGVCFGEKPRFLQSTSGEVSPNSLRLTCIGSIELRNVYHGMGPLHRMLLSKLLCCWMIIGASRYS